MTPTVYIAEDATELRVLIRTWLERDGRLAVVGEGGDGETALAQIAETQPAVVVLDLAMPRSHGANTIPTIRNVAPDAKVLVVTGKEPADAGSSLDQADGYLLKPVDMPELVRLVHELAGEPR